MGEKFWMVFVEGQRTPSYKHHDISTAMKEAERLIGYCQNRGRKAYILESMLQVIEVESPVRWEECDDLPLGIHIDVRDLPF